MESFVADAALLNRNVANDEFPTEMPYLNPHVEKKNVFFEVSSFQFL